MKELDSVIEVPKYLLIEANHSAKLQDLVNTMIRDVGYELYGTPFAAGDWLYQAMIRGDEFGIRQIENGGLLKIKIPTEIHR